MHHLGLPNNGLLLIGLHRSGIKMTGWLGGRVELVPCGFVGNDDDSVRLSALRLVAETG